MRMNCETAPHVESMLREYLQHKQIHKHFHGSNTTTYNITKTNMIYNVFYTVHVMSLNHSHTVRVCMSYMYLTRMLSELQYDTEVAGKIIRWFELVTVL